MEVAVKTRRSEKPARLRQSDKKKVNLASDVECKTWHFMTAVQTEASLVAQW